MNFNASSGKSEKLHYDVLKIALWCAFLRSKEELYLVTLKSDPNFEEKTDFLSEKLYERFGEF